MPVAFFVTLLVIAAGRVARHVFGVSRLASSAALVVVGAVLWLLASRLHAAAMRRAARDLEAVSGRSHGVPRWVEELRNVAFGLALGGLVPLVEEFVPD